MKIIYGVFETDESPCLYVGQTGDLAKRIKNHKERFVDCIIKVLETVPSSVAAAKRTGMSLAAYMRQSAYAAADKQKGLDK